MSFTKLTNKKTPNLILADLINFLNLSSGRALDLGAGPLMESRLLLESGYNVDAVDKDPASAEIANGIRNEKFKFFAENIVDFDFEKEKYDLVVSLLTLPFLSLDDFEKVFVRIVGSLKPGGHICISLFGDRDEWATTQTKMTFLTRQRVEKLLKPFEVIQLREEDKIAPTVKDTIKKWHIFNIVAKKL